MTTINQDLLIVVFIIVLSGFALFGVVLCKMYKDMNRKDKHQPRS